MIYRMKQSQYDIIAGSFKRSELEKDKVSIKQAVLNYVNTVFMCRPTVVLMTDVIYLMEDGETTELHSELVGVEHDTLITSIQTY